MEVCFSAIVNYANLFTNTGMIKLIQHQIRRNNLNVFLKDLLILRISVTAYSNYYICIPVTCIALNPGET